MRTRILLTTLGICLLSALRVELRKMDLTMRIALVHEQVQDLKVIGSPTEPRLAEHRLNQQYLAAPQRDPQQLQFHMQINEKVKTR